ncbi:MAG: DUF192 domain-containing protein [Actinobacteria bacterium ATB1]|nr:DUF192 domain-containing protein [Actinobacteria bacterium ATB1]
MSEIHFPGRVVYARGATGRSKGLLGRSEMRRDEALWLSPCKSVHTFGMRFPIDVAFLDASGTILHFVGEMRPHRLTRLVWGAAGALEMHAGTLEAVGARVGDVILWANPD